MAAFQRHFLVYFFSRVRLQRSQFVLSQRVRAEARGGGSKAPSCGRPGGGNSQTLSGHHTDNLLVQMMRETKCTDPHAGKQAKLHCLFFFVCLLLFFYGGDILKWIFKVCHKNMFPL